MLRDLVPAVIGVLVRRGADFAAAEDAVQDALVEAVRVWPDDPPDDPKGWLITVAWRKFLDAARAHTSRRQREERVEREPGPGPVEAVDDTLQLYFLCAHPSLTPASSVALTLRAVGGLTTRQIAQAYLVPEATMAQRISRAKRTVADVRACSTWSSTRATPATSTSLPRRSASPGNSRPRPPTRRWRACWR
jgi:RNA polymerase sigma factor (sigma-70 family)